MYTEFYGLKNPPFENTPNPQFLYLSRQHREVLSALLYAVESAKGMVLVAGSVGTGKTTLIHSLLKNIRQNHSIIHIVNPHTHFNDILRYLAKKIGVPVEGLNTPDWIDLIFEKLKMQDAAGRRTVLIVDEAHLLTEQNLENIRLLLNLETEKNKLLQIVLVGQNEIYDTLQKDSLKSLKQRIVINRKLEPLKQKDTQNYIHHRLKIAGRDDKLFSSGALFWIWKTSKGIPRLINQICDNALLIGFAEEKQVIGKKVIKEVVNDMQSSYQTAPNKNRRPILNLAAIICFFVVAGFIFTAIDLHHKQKNQTTELQAAFPIQVPAEKRNSAQFMDSPETDKTVKINQTIEPSPQNAIHAQAVQIEHNISPSDSADDHHPPKNILLHENSMRLDLEQRTAGTNDPPEQAGLSAQPTPVSLPKTVEMFSKNTHLKTIHKQVNQNDNLYNIIIKEFGYCNDTLMDLVLMANPQISNPNLLFIGQKIVLPKIKREDIVIQGSQGDFYIYYASLKALDIAQKEIEKLELKENAFIIPSNQAGDVVYRIYLGKFSSRGDAEKVLDDTQFKHLPPLDE